MKHTIRQLILDDAERISKAFDEIGWNKPVEKYRKCFERQQAQQIVVLVAEVDGEFAGYLQVVWHPDYSTFPEIQDLNVLPAFRRRR